jgi:hypothetical protein
MVCVFMTNADSSTSRKAGRRSRAYPWFSALSQLWLRRMAELMIPTRL